MVKMSSASATISSLRNHIISYSQEDNANHINSVTKAKLNSHVMKRLQSEEYDENPKSARLDQPTTPTYSASTDSSASAATSASSLQMTVADCCVKNKSNRTYNKRVQKDPISVLYIDNLQTWKCKQKCDLLANMDYRSVAISDRLSETTNENDECGDQVSSRRCLKEQYKCQDVLSMVLTAKKRSLLQDPQVQAALSNLMKAISS